MERSRASDILEKIHQSNLEREKIYESEPHIGVFWIHPNTNKLLHVDSDPQSRGMDLGDSTKTPYSTHHKVWGFLKRNDGLGEFNHLNYEQISRGRVHYHKDSGTSHVYINQIHLDNEDLKNEIIKEYRLNKSKTRFSHDDHYPI